MNDKNDLPYLSSSEWRIFLVLATSPPLSVKAIREELTQRHEGFRQGISTLSTLLQRLIANGYVTRERDQEGTIVYGPLVPLEPALKRHAERFLEDFTQFRPEQLVMLRQMVEERLRSTDGPASSGSDGKGRARKKPRAS